MAKYPRNSSEYHGLIQAYLRHAAAGPDDDNDFWAWEAVGEVAREGSADEAWSLLIDLVRESPDALMGNVAAGPLEDTIAEHGPELIDRIEAAAANDPRFQEALGGVWIRDGHLPPAVMKRLVRASAGQIEILPARKRRRNSLNLGDDLKAKG
jgi:hypothetical protein